MTTKFEDIISNENYEVTTTNKEKFSAEMTCRLWAMVYIRFGRNVDMACAAMGRILQSTPVETNVAEKLIAVGLTLMKEDSFREMPSKLILNKQNWFEKFSRQYLVIDCSSSQFK